MLFNISNNDTFPKTVQSRSAHKTASHVNTKSDLLTKEQNKSNHGINEETSKIRCL